jgi:pectate lyase
MRRACAFLLLVGIVFPISDGVAQIPAFPGADGAAANVTGGRGGIVYKVTKMDSAIDDPERNDFGTLRYGLTNGNFPAGVPRTIVFDVGGVFHLGRLNQAGWDTNGNGWDAQSRLTVGGSNITFAGQTAPGAGVIFMGGGLKPQGNNNIIRNITVASGYGMRNWYQPGEAFPSQPVAGNQGVGFFPDATVFDGMDIAGTNIMIDHVSTLYATDETISMNEVANNITVQYSNISQGQNYPQWDAEGGGYTGHALGSLLEAATNAKISFHHNLYAHQKSRMPQTQGSAGAYYDFRNNVFYNWLGTAGSRGSAFWNLVGNFYLAGDGGDNPAGGTSVAINQSGGGTGVIGTNSSIYRNGNFLDSNKDADANDGVALSNSGAANPLWQGGVETYKGTTDSATAAFDRVLNYMGANWWTRDGVIDTPDERIIQEARTGTGKIKAWADDPWNNDPNEGVEWRALLNTPTTARDANWDTEATVGYGVGDGMPTGWELQHGLDPNARDDAGDFDNDGYTNLEEYLNDVAAWPAPGFIVFDATTNSRYAQITNWDSNPDPARDLPWQPSRYDTAVINSGTVVVDAVGQHAGNLLLGTNPGDSATLNITDGWIKVEDAAHGLSDGATVVGDNAGATAVLNLSGGKLTTKTLLKGAGGTFNFTGGTLSAETVGFDLLNQGGEIAPGNSPGVTLVLGDLTMTSGSIEIEILGNQVGQYDQIMVADHLTAGGTLEVLLEGYTPLVGDVFELFGFASASGGFSFNLPSLTAGLDWDTSDLLVSGELSVIESTIENADFDGDGDVDGRDFLIWQRGFGLIDQGDNSLGDANGDGDVDAGDLAIWQTQYANPSEPLSSQTAVPEPAASLLMALAVGVWALKRQL